jgi:lysozyme
MTAIMQHLQGRKNPRLRRAIVGWIMLALCLAALAYGFVRNWAPSRDDFATQGPLFDANNGIIRWGAVRIAGADFAYLVATDGSKGRNTNFALNRENARAEGLDYGVAHRFALCTLASDQATNFDTFVPRDASALPPLVLLNMDEECAKPPTRALVISELTTFLNQIEAHMGKPAMLSPSAEFEERYQISAAINRTLWLRRNFLQPDYAQRPWVMWQANTYLHIDGANGAVAWNVVAAQK